MPSRNTLLHFLTGSADTKSTRAFQRVLAGKIDDLVNKIKTRYTQTKDSPWVRELLQKRNLLDLEPEELERLLRVERSKDKIEFQVKLTPEKLSTPKTPQEIEKKVALFYTENRLRFDSPNDVKFEPESLKLSYQGPLDIAESLLNSFGMKENEANKLLEQAKKEQANQLADIQFTVLVHSENLLSPKTEDQIETLVTRFYQDKDFYFDGPDSIHFDKDTKELSYSGPKDLAEELLKKIGFKEDAIKKIKSGKPLVQKTKTEEQKKTQEEPEKVQTLKRAIPLSKISIETIPVDRQKLSDWLSKEGLTENTTKIVDYEEQSEEANLLFTGSSHTLKLLLRDVFGLSDNVIDQTMNADQYKRR
jgi:hypothetical protein